METQVNKLNKIKKRCLSDTILRIALFTVMLLFGLSYLFMLFWMVVTSFRNLNVFTQRPADIFSGITFHQIVKNYTEAFTKKVDGFTLPQTIINTIIYVVGVTVVSTFVPMITGYVVAKYNFKLKKIIVNCAVMTMIIPTIGSMMTTYRFMASLKLTNTFLGVFLMSSGGIGFSFLMFRGFFASIPWEYAESGFIDGASNLRVFWSIMMPQARSIIVSIMIVSFIGAWNDYFTPYLYLSENPTIALYVQLLSVNQRFKANYPIQMAVLVFMVAVVLIIYAFFSKRIMESMSAGGLKG